MVGKVLNGLLCVPDGVQQEGTSFFQALQHVILVQVGRNMTGNKIRFNHQVGRTDGRVTKTQVRCGDTPRFLRVISKISLAILIGGFADDHDGVLIGTYGSIGTQSVKFAFKCSSALPREISGSKGREVKVTSSTIPTVNLFLGSAIFRF